MLKGIRKDEFISLQIIASITTTFFATKQYILENVIYMHSPL